MTEHTADNDVVLSDMLGALGQAVEAARVDRRSADNDAGCCAEYRAEIARQGQEITRLSVAVRQRDNIEMAAFLDGWYAHARSPEQLPEDAWRTRVTSPG